MSIVDGLQYLVIAVSVMFAGQFLVRRWRARLDAELLDLRQADSWLRLESGELPGLSKDWAKGTARVAAPGQVVFIGSTPDVLHLTVITLRDATRAPSVPSSWIDAHVFEVQTSHAVLSWAVPRKVAAAVLALVNGDTRA